MNLMGAFVAYRWRARNKSQNFVIFSQALTEDQWRIAGYYYTTPVAARVQLRRLHSPECGLLRTLSLWITQNSELPEAWRALTQHGGVKRDPFRNLDAPGFWQQICASNKSGTAREVSIAHPHVQKVPLLLGVGFVEG
jgi:hypothetical protein